MKIYKFTGASTIETVNVEAEQTKKVKIKVTHVMPTLSDINIFTGSVKKNPLIAGRMAIGVVSDDRAEYGLKRGTKVILDPYIVDKTEKCDNVKTRGLDAEGFMRDFVYLDIDDFVPFPEDVEEEEAIFIEKIAVALEALNSFSAEKGDYIAIIGASVVGNILAQLALYFQLIPIVIDDDEYFLEKVEQMGVYYTVNATTDTPYERVFEITGGRMCQHTVIEYRPGVTGAYLFKLSANGGNVTIVCEPYAVKTLDADVTQISKKQLQVNGVVNGEGEFNSAINMVAQRILNLDGFIEKKVGIKDAEAHLKELAKNPNHFFASIIEM